ncbi:Protein PAC2 [Candida viswanathii]|uniref:Protein PAC2 n=1 Tax=Candida viswanathii TaxID=5486 RepID=A0A367XPP2_9ASCO|nr:Protein PAC2 [Candida viswanathii]
MKTPYSINDRISTVDNHLGTIRYIGTLPPWGPNTIAYGGSILYSHISSSGTFIKSSNTTLNHQHKSFIDVIREKYLDLEYLGWDKLNKFQSDLNNLKQGRIFESLVNITNLELSCNLLTDLNEVSKIIDRLPNLTQLNVNGNRFSEFSGDQTTHGNIKLLKVSGTLIPITMLTKLVKKFPNLEELYISGNCYADSDIQEFEVPHNVRVLDELRINHNPVFDDLSIDDMTVQLIGRFNCSKGSLWKLNGTYLTEDEIANGELYFISKVDQGVYHIDNEPRWSTLLDKYGKKDQPTHAPVDDYKEWIELVISIPSSPSISKKFLRNTSILQFKGIISSELNNLSFSSFPHTSTPTRARYLQRSMN